MVFKRVTYALLALSAVLALAGGLTSSASAQSACNAFVDDGANILSSQDEARITQALQGLEREGPVARVRTVASLGSQNGNDFFEQLVSNCPPWQSADERPKTNLIVFMLAPNEEQSWIFWGSQWESELHSDDDVICNDIMNPRFADGEFTQGFLDGISATKEAVQPASHTSVVQIAGIIIGGILLLFVVGFAVKRLGERRKEKDEQLTEQQKAQRQFRQLANNVLALEARSSELTLAYRALRPRLSAEHRLQLEQLMDDFKHNADQVTGRYEALRVEDPDRELSTRQYVDIATIAADINTKADETSGIANHAERILDKYQL